MIPVTDEMVAAARRQIPERWGLSNLRDAIVAALEAAPKPAERIFDQRYADEDVAAFLERAPVSTLLAMRTEAAVTIDGLEGPGVQDATGSAATIPVHRPQPHPALAGPLALGGITEIASRLEVARSTVVGWIKRADKIGMPQALAALAAGPVFDLIAVESWHKAWKAGDAADGEADA